MDKIILTIGIAALIVSFGIIILSFKSSSTEFKNQSPDKKHIKKLKNEITAVLSNFSKFGDGYFRNQKSDVQKEAIRLKIESEKIIGISAKSNVGISIYERPTNSIGLDQIKTDLSSLSRQLTNLE